VTVTLAVEQVRKRYGTVEALAGVDLEVGAGEVVGLLGPNGAGKTTLVSVVTGLRRLDAGSVTVAGIDVGREPARARAAMGVAPQETGVYDVLTVRENLAFFGELCGLRRRAAAARVEALAESLLLGPLLDRTAGALSGGQRRRLHTAIALVGRPALLLLDEPTVGADVATRSALLDVVLDLAHEGCAVVYSTHYLPEVEALDASVAMLLAGKVIARGPVPELVAQYGVAVAELRFDGAAPECALEGVEVSRGDDVLRLTARDPAAAAAAVIARLGADAARLTGVDLLRPSLDSVFLALTGRRYGSEGAGDVVAA
jgi:ABC-type multidrug transport system ATPase subunit